MALQPLIVLRHPVYRGHPAPNHLHTGNLPGTLQLGVPFLGDRGPRPRQVWDLPSRPAYRSVSGPVDQHAAGRPTDPKYTQTLLEEIGLFNDQTKVSLIEHQLRAYCFVHQALLLGEGVWGRSGSSSINEAQFYKKSHWSTMYILPDIFSFRLVLSLIREQQSMMLVIYSIMSHFDIANEPGGSRAGEEGREQRDRPGAIDTCYSILPIRVSSSRRVRSTVLFVMDIFTKMTSLDIPVSLSFSKSIYRYLLVQFLLRKSRSRSEIQDGLPVSSSSSIYYGNFIQSTKSSNLTVMVDEVLDSFCDRIPASDRRPVIYRIKQPLGWMLYDPLLPVKFIGGDDHSKSESICSYFEGLQKFPDSNTTSDRGDDNGLKKRRIGEGDASSAQNSPFRDDGDPEGVPDSEERQFISRRFSRFPVKLCHIPRNDHFSSRLHFKSSRNMYIKSALLSNLLQLALPQLLGVTLDQTILEDEGVVHQTFILFFNLVNMEIMDHVYQNLQAKERGQPHTHVEFRTISLCSGEEVEGQFFSLASKRSSLDGSGTELGQPSVLRALVYYPGEDGENDDYQYFAVHPQLCSSIKRELSRQAPGKRGPRTASPME
ncbi:UBR1-like ring finger related treble clef, partial [Cryptosporidium canis]